MKVQNELESLGIEYEVNLTEGRGHAIEIASNLRESKYDLIVAVGGDGTVHEVANGLRGSGKRMGIIPMGIMPILLPDPLNPFATSCTVPSPPTATIKSYLDSRRFDAISIACPLPSVRFTSYSIPSDSNSF